MKRDETQYRLGSEVLTLELEYGTPEDWDESLFPAADGWETSRPFQGFFVARRVLLPSGVYVKPVDATQRLERARLDLDQPLSRPLD